MKLLRTSQCSKKFEKGTSLCSLILGKLQRWTEDLAQWYNASGTSLTWEGSGFEPQNCSPKIQSNQTDRQENKENPNRYKRYFECLFFQVVFVKC